MKKLIKVLLFTFLLSNNADAQEKADLIRLVYKWNELHNTRETSVFKDIYAPTVLFYGKNKTREICYQNKTAFLNPYFKQEIISSITFNYFPSGVVKCSFRKKVTYKKRIKEHDCYLLVKQKSGKWYITGESDLATDKNLNVQMDLGEEFQLDVSEEPVSTRVNNTPFFIGGIVLVVVGGFLVYRRTQIKRHFPSKFKTETSQVKPNVLAGQPNAVIETEKLVTTVKEAVLQEIGKTKIAVPKELTEVEKGNAFEKYVVSRFVGEYFELKEWRSDKYHEGTYATSSQWPDLEYHFKTKHHSKIFAIECKWRSEFIKGRIEWAKGHQLVNYRDYERKSSITVFVVIGVGGKPDDPGSVYVLPLSQIRSNVLSESQLKKYYRHRKGNFYLNIDPMRLE